MNIIPISFSFLFIPSNKISRFFFENRDLKKKKNGPNVLKYLNEKFQNLNLWVPETRKNIEKMPCPVPFGNNILIFPYIYCDIQLPTLLFKGR